MFMRLTKNAVIRRKGEYVILGNIRTGKWIRINQKLYEMFDVYLQLDDQQKADVYKKIGKLVQTLTDLELVTNCEYEQEEKLRSITFAITNRCNLQCLHCGYSASPNDRCELSKDDIMDAIFKLRDIEVLGITGGEPMFHKDFPAIADFIGKNVYGKKTLMTNATLISEKTVDLVINNFDGVAISLDAASKITCDKMRGMGVFSKVISAIKLLQKKEFNDISLSFTETEINKHEREQFINLCAELGVEPVVRIFLPVGRGMINKNRLEISDVKQGFLDKSLKIDQIAEYRKNLAMTTRCGAGTDCLYIQFNGDIYPCPVTGVNEKMRMGNIKNVHNFQDFVLGRNELEGYRNYTNISHKNTGKCSECDVRDFCWRCMQEYYEIFQDGNDDTNECAYRRQFLNSVVWGD